MEKPPEVKAEKAVKRIRSVDTKTRVFSPAWKIRSDTVFALFSLKEKDHARSSLLTAFLIN
jgi:hypothetical protein